MSSVPEMVLMPRIGLANDRPLERPKFEKEKKTATGTHSISGKVLYASDNFPNRSQKLNFFAKTIFGSYHYLGSSKSDHEGRFQFSYNLKSCWLNPVKEIVVGVVEKRYPFAKQGLYIAKQEIPLQKFTFQLPKKSTKIEAGALALTYADTSSDITAVKTPPMTQMQSPYYFWRLFKAIISELPKSIFVTLFKRWLSVKSVQKIYDSFGPQYPKRPTTGDQVLNELLNEICATNYIDDGSKVTWRAEWDGLELDLEESLPNVEVVAAKSNNGKLTLEKISIQYRGETEAATVTPEDENYPWALYIVRSVFAIKGEAEIHLGEGHLLPGIIAKSFLKYIKPEHPLYQAVGPHLGQLDFINWLGSKGIIFGKGSVLDASALNEGSIAEVIIRSMEGKADYRSYKPREPINSEHYLALAENKHYDLLKQFYSEYVQQHWEAIKLNWKDIYYLSGSIQKQFTAIPPITTSAKAPQEGDKERLIQLLAWVVNKTTFLHWAAHSRQQLLTDVRQGSLGIEGRGKDNDGRLAMGGNTSVDSASRQLFIARVLLNFEGDSFRENPYGNMSEELRKLIADNMDSGAYKGYPDINRMHITTQI